MRHPLIKANADWLDRKYPARLQWGWDGEICASSDVQEAVAASLASYLYRRRGGEKEFGDRLYRLGRKRCLSYECPVFSSASSSTVFCRNRIDVADSRELDAYQSRPVRERQQAALFHAKPVTQRQAESRESDQLQHKRATRQDFVQKKESYLDALGRILPDPFSSL